MSLPSRFKGQALILALITLVVLVVGVIVLFNSGQAVSKKMQLVNTADAAAYSAAVQQARAFNLVSYMNRATVANQVAMAQMVSWYSWTNFAISATDHLKSAVQAVAVVLDITVVGAEFGAVLQEVVSILSSAKSALKEGRSIENMVFDAAATAISNLDYAYSKASRLIVSPAESADLVSMTKKIVRLNDPKAQISAMGLVSLARDANSANGYVQHYTIPSGGTFSGADRFANVVMEARDPFSRERNGHFGFSIGGGVLFSAGLSLDKRGGTDLVAYRNWVGTDTLNLHIWHPGCSSGWTHTPKTCHEYIPLAWGGAAAVDKTPSSFATVARKDNGWSDPYQGNNPEYATKGNYPAYGGALDNGESSSWALSYPADGGTSNAWIKPYFSLGTVGLPDYDDIVKDKATVPYLNGKSAFANHVNKLDVGPMFTVLVEESMTDVRTSSNINGLGGPPDFDVQDKAIKGKITAISTAQVYFSRSRKLFPRIFDSRRETGSLFSPYWHARLVETPCSRRLIADAAYGAVGACTP